MDDSKARRIVVGCVVATGVVTSIRSLAHGEIPPLRILVGVLLVGAVLSAATEFQPDAAAALAVVILISASMDAGPETFGAATAAVRRGAPPVDDPKPGEHLANRPIQPPPTRVGRPS